MARLQTSVRRLGSAVVLALMIGVGLIAGAGPASASTANYLGTEWDNCSGKLYVKDTTGTYRYIPRDDANHGIGVYIDGNGYWYWKCGSTPEYSRGTMPWRFRVEWLSVRHATDSREIRWQCYELL